MTLEDDDKEGVGSATGGQSSVSREELPEGKTTSTTTAAATTASTKVVVDKSKVIAREAMLTLPERLAFPSPVPRGTTLTAQPHKLIELKNGM